MSDVDERVRDVGKAFYERTNASPARGLKLRARAGDRDTVTVFGIHIAAEMFITRYGHRGRFLSSTARGVRNRRSRWGDKPVRSPHDTLCGDEFSFFRISHQSWVSCCDRFTATFWIFCSSSPITMTIEIEFKAFRINLYKDVTAEYVLMCRQYLIVGLITNYFEIS